MTNVYWFEQTEADVPFENDWLAECETAQLKRLQFLKRRTEWRLGRWTAKRAVAMYLGQFECREAFTRIKVVSSASGAPTVSTDDPRTNLSISLTHSSGKAMCAIAASVVALGCDLEIIEVRCDAFATDYFTAEEQALIARSSTAERARLVTLLWSAKESALKALHEGLRIDTRSLVVSLLPCSSTVAWHPLKVSYRNEAVFDGWWQEQDRFVLTLVSTPPPSLPIRLHPENSIAGPLIRTGTDSSLSGPVSNH